MFTNKKSKREKKTKTKFEFQSLRERFANALILNLN